MKKYNIKINAHVENYPITVEAENEVMAEEIALEMAFPYERKSWDVNTDIKEI